MLKNLVFFVLSFFVSISYAQVGIDTDYWDWTEVADHHNSVVQILSVTDDAKSYGTGVVVSDYKIVTAYHVVDGAKTFFVVKGDKKIQCSIGPSSPSYDVCILVANEKIGLPKIKIADSSPKEKEIVEICGFGGSESLRHFKAELRLFSGSMLGVDGHVIPGDSGGPVLNSENELIGVVSGGIGWSKETIVHADNYTMSATWPIRCGGLDIISELMKK